ncbi:MAG: hypothetical protein V4671_11500 [Armatimonadota bacterium]
MLKKRCNIVLVGNESVGHRGDFQRIAGYIREYAPHIRPFVYNDRHYPLRRWTLAPLPTMVFSPVGLNHLRMVRGRVFAGSPLSKSEEYIALTAAGVPVPRYHLMTEADPRPDVSGLGKYVVVKPDRGRRGAHVRIMRSSRARWESTKSRIEGHSGDLLAQEFIYTGERPISYRVTTLFGEVLWAIKVEADSTRAPLSGPEEFSATPGLSIVSNSKGCVMSLMNDPDIIRFAEAAHRAFPEIPLLGVDVIQRRPDGALFIAEVNASGWVWHFSSPMGLRAQAEFGFKFEEQFDGLRKASRILSERTLQYAK